MAETTDQEGIKAIIALQKFAGIIETEECLPPFGHCYYYVESRCWRFLD